MMMISLHCNYRPTLLIQIVAAMKLYVLHSKQLDCATVEAYDDDQNLYLLASADAEISRYHRFAECSVIEIATN